MTITIHPPQGPPATGQYRAEAARGNTVAADAASRALTEALDGTAPIDRVLLKAAAGAGKSYALKRLVREALEHDRCDRVAVIAFTNKQLHPLAASLGEMLGRDHVCLFVKDTTIPSLPRAASDNATVVSTASAIPPETKILIATSHKLGAIGELNRQKNQLGAGHNGTAVYDVLFVDEAWQLPHHLFDKVTRAAPIWVGVGDVGQLPPLEIGANPWRGDPGYNPYRAWPTDYDEDERTWSRELPAVWRPTAGHLALWRAFYPEWESLNCVAAPGDRTLVTGLAGVAGEIWTQVGTGIPTLLEVDGLPEPEAADIDLPLMQFVEDLLDQLFTAGFTLETADYDDNIDLTGTTTITKPGANDGDPLVAVLATRNQAVDDAAEAVDRLREKHGLSERDIVSSTVDSYQGQTNGLTVAVHPLTGAADLNEFNSAFGRLAVTCTRATHGLLLVSRPGLDQLLTDAPARPGNPYGEPGNRQLPRQTHQRILATFARGTLTLAPADD